MIWKTQKHSLDLTTRAHVMGILNVTPDSFSDGGNFSDIDISLKHAKRMILEGAAIIDIGGESTRPGALPVTAKDEIARTMPVIEKLRREWDGLISIDTTKAVVAQAALENGADIVNDVSGLTADVEMVSVCNQFQCGVAIMHMQGRPQTMQNNPQYDDVCREMRSYFEERYQSITQRGIDPQRLCFDPGIGFGKTLTHNLSLLRNLKHLSPHGRPLLLGVSRKSLIGTLTQSVEPQARDAGTIALTTLARREGVMLHRVHEVKCNLDALRIAEAWNVKELFSCD